MLERVPRRPPGRTRGRRGSAGFLPGPQQETHHRRLCGAREAALLPPPHLVGQLWVAEVSTQGHWCGHVYHIDRWPMAGRGKQIHMITGTFAPHQVLGATDHLGADMGGTHRVKKPICTD